MYIHHQLRSSVVQIIVSPAADSTGMVQEGSMLGLIGCMLRLWSGVDFLTGTPLLFIS